MTVKIDTLVTMNKMEKVNTVHEVTPSGKQMFSKKNFRNCIILCSMEL